jgi:hypothetical protein
MTWKVNIDLEFLEEIRSFPEETQTRIFFMVSILEIDGPELGRPQVDTLHDSKHSNMKELRFNADDGVWRVAFAFDPKREAILLVGGDKAGENQKKFYKKLIKTADNRFNKHLEELKEGEKNA